MAILLFLQSALISASFWLLWRLFGNCVVKSSLYDVPGPPRRSWISGNLNQIFDPAGLPWMFSTVKKYGGVFKYYGFLGDEQLYVTDARALHHIVVKDQYAYEETSMFIERNKLVFGDGLLSTLGDRHRRQRKILNPVFSTANMRNLVPIFNSVTRQVRQALIKQVETKGARHEIEMHHWLSRVALELIGQAGFGRSFENFDDENATSEFGGAMRDLFPALFGTALPGQFLPYVSGFGPAWLRGWILRQIPSKNIQRIIHIVDVLHKTSVEILREKQQDLEVDETVLQQTSEGRDIMSVLLKANALVDKSERLPENEILGQVSTLVFAASDTTTNAIARALQILATNPDTQGKLRDEIVQAQAEGDLDYDALVALPYMDAFVREVMRLYSTFIAVTRTTRKDIVLPLGIPIKSVDGKEDIHEIFLKNNTNVTVGIAASNRDPAIWGDDADQFKPERWMEQNTAHPNGLTKERLPGVYSGMMSFFGGGRACIGFKFAQLEMKAVLAMLVSTFVFEPPDEEIVWRNSVIATPATKGKESETPHLPLKMSLSQSK